jgi:beta-phosphoglucomutase
MTVHIHGRNNQHTLEYLTGKPVMDDELERLTHQKEAIYRQLCLEQGAEFRLSPGANELLNFLVAQDFPHMIATVTGITNLDFCVKHLSLLNWFDLATIVFDDGRRPGKPAPDIYLEAQIDSNWNPDNVRQWKSRIQELKRPMQRELVKLSH